MTKIKIAVKEVISQVSENNACEVGEISFNLPQTLKEILEINQIDYSNNSNLIEWITKEFYKNIVYIDKKISICFDELKKQQAIQIHLEFISKVQLVNFNNNLDTEIEFSGILDKNSYELNFDIKKELKQQITRRRENSREFVIDTIKKFLNDYDSSNLSIEDQREIMFLLQYLDRISSDYYGEYLKDYSNEFYRTITDEIRDYDTYFDSMELEISFEELLSELEKKERNNKI